MDKSIHAYEYKLFLDLLRQARVKAGITQGEVALRLGESQTFISKCERGERRIDVLELYLWCDALGISISTFVQTLDAAIRGAESAPR